MEDLLAVLVTGLLSFMVSDYALGRALVKDPLRAVIAAVFAVLVVFALGVLGFREVIDL